MEVLAQVDLTNGLLQTGFGIVVIVQLGFIGWLIREYTSSITKQTTSLMELTESVKELVREVKDIANNVEEHFEHIHSHLHGNGDD